MSQCLVNTIVQEGVSTTKRTSIRPSKAFITEVKNKQKNLVDSTVRLEEIRKTHESVLGVVDFIGENVNDMVLKQRSEYMIAYEEHMFELHKQIFLLRERLDIITNEKTRDERIKVLKAQLNHFEKSALDWDNKHEIIIEKLRMKSTALDNEESENDWLIDRIQQEQNKIEMFNAIHQGQKLASSQSSGGSVNSFSTTSLSSSLNETLGDDSYYAIAWKPKNPSRQWKNLCKPIDRSATASKSKELLQTTKTSMNTSTSSSSQSLSLQTSKSLSQLPPHAPNHRKLNSSTSQSDIKLPFLSKTSQPLSNNNSVDFINDTNRRKSASNIQSRSLSASSSLPLFTGSMTSTPKSPKSSSKYNKLNNLYKRKEKEAIQELIITRAKKEEILEFIENCANQTRQGLWRRFVKSSDTDFRYVLMSFFFVFVFFYWYFNIVHCCIP